MTGKKKRMPALRPGMSVADFKAYYWMKADLIRFARRLGLPTHGYKPELTARIDRRLRGLPDQPKKKQQTAKSRDSDKPLRRTTAVVNYKSDAKTRAFFESQIGPVFHFTYHLNQWRMARKNLTYGDLVDEWLAEKERRRGSKAKIAQHGEYNRFVRDFFADEQNKGKSLRDAAAGWNSTKNNRGDRRYKPRKKRG